MTRWDDEVRDLDHYLEPQVFLASPDATRRSIQAAFGCVNRLRNNREATLGRDRYRQLALDHRAGHVTEALVWIRGSYEHQLDVLVAPSVELLLPSKRLFPGRWTFPGSNPTWRPLTDIMDGIAPSRRIPALINAYEEHMAGVIAGYAFDDARLFLVEYLGEFEPAGN